MGLRESDLFLGLSWELCCCAPGAEALWRMELRDDEMVHGVEVGQRDS